MTLVYSLAFSISSFDVGEASRRESCVLLMHPRATPVSTTPLVESLKKNVMPKINLIGSAAILQLRLASLV